MASAWMQLQRDERDARKQGWVRPYLCGQRNNGPHSRRRRAAIRTESRFDSADGTGDRLLRILGARYNHKEKAP